MSAAAGSQGGPRTTNVYQNYERPFPLTVGDPHAESRSPWLKVLTHQSNPVGDAFFAQTNMDRIQRMLQQAVRDKTGYVIDKQSPEQLGFIMQHIYSDHANSQPMSIDDEITRLDILVINEAFPMVTSALAAYLAYLRDASRIKEPIPRGLNTSIRGTRQLTPHPWVGKG